MPAARKKKTADVSNMGAVPAERAKKGAAGTLNELGSSGTRLFGGNLYVEYNAQLAGSRGLQTFEEMRKSDAQVAATLNVMGLPIRATHWHVEPGHEEAPAGAESETTDQDREIAEFVESQLFHKAAPGWDDFLRQALTMLAFGFALFEKVYAVEDGRVVLKKLAQRLPTSVYRWHYKAEGTPDVTQQILGSDDGKPAVIELPGSKLLLFSFGREGDNYAGVSVLRSAYKHWYIKDQLYKLDAVKHDRQAIGIPVITLPLSHGDTDVTEAETILSNLRATEKNYVILPSPDWKFEFAKIGGDTATNVKDSVEHHNREISKNVLAQFLELGAAGSGGSYSLSEDQSSIFTLSLTAIARQIAEVVNRDLIRELVDANYDVPAGYCYPSLRFQKLGEVAYDKLATAIAAYAGAGILTPDEDLEGHVRKILDLPEKREDETSPEDQQEDLAEGEDPAAEMDAEADDEEADAAPADPEAEAQDAEAQLADLEKQVADLTASETAKAAAGYAAHFGEDAEAEIFRAPVDAATKAKISEGLKKWWAAHGKTGPADLKNKAAGSKATADAARAKIAQSLETFKKAAAPVQAKLDALKKQAAAIPAGKRTPAQRRALRAAQADLRKRIKALRAQASGEVQAQRAIKAEALKSAAAAKKEAAAISKAVDGAIKKARADVEAKNATRADAIRSLADQVRANVEAARSAREAAASLSGPAKKEAAKNAKALAASLRRDNETLRKAARKLRDEAKAERDAFQSKADLIREATGTKKAAMSEEDARALGFSDPDELRAFLDAKAVFSPDVILSVQRHG